MLAKTPDPLRTHLQLNAGTYGAFNDLRDAMHRFLRARKGLATMGSGGKSKATEDDPMDVDVLYGANTKKGKGKGKDGKQSKFFDSTCMNCQRYGHRKRDCWAQGRERSGAGERHEQHEAGQG